MEILNEGPSGIAYSLDEKSFHCGVRHQLEGIRPDKSTRLTVKTWFSPADRTYYEKLITDHSTFLGRIVIGQ
jgi:hypothetical protein